MLGFLVGAVVIGSAQTQFQEREIAKATPARVSMSARSDPKREEVRIWFKNVGGVPTIVRLVEATWNECPLRAHFPIEINLLPSKAKTLTLRPSRSGVLFWGDRLFVKHEVFHKGRRVGGGTFGTNEWSGPSVGLIRSSVPSSLDWDVDFSTPDNGFPCQVRDLLVQHGTTILAAKKPLVELKSNTRRLLSKLKVWDRPLKYSFEWRPSPWAKWIPVKETLKPPVEPRDPGQLG